MNVKMHMCDIQARKQVYTYGKAVEDMTKDKLESSKFSQCLSAKGTPSIIKINDTSEK